MLAAFICRKLNPMSSLPLRLYPAKPSKVYLYGTCLIDSLYPDSGIAAIELLESQGIEVIFEQAQSCCGQPPYNSGYAHQAARVADAQVALFPLPIPIVVLSGSCAGMMRHHYPKLLIDHALGAFCERVFELSEFLYHVLNIQLKDKGAPERIALHTSCAARREMHSHISCQKLLQQLTNVTLVEHQDANECCGFGGTFALKHGDISAAMVQDKTHNLLSVKVDRYVSADWGCMANINGALAKQQAPLEGMHIASYLWQRMGGEKS